MKMMMMMNLLISLPMGGGGANTKPCWPPKVLSVQSPLLRWPKTGFLSSSCCKSPPIRIRINSTRHRSINGRSRSSASESGSGVPARDRVIDFGKHKGKMLGTLPQEYLRWVSKNLRAGDYLEWAKLADEVMEDDVYRDRVEWEEVQRLLCGEGGWKSSSSLSDGGVARELERMSKEFGWDNDDKTGWSKVDFGLLGTSKSGRIPRIGHNNSPPPPPPLSGTTKKEIEEGRGGSSSSNYSNNDNDDGSNGGRRRRRRRERVRLKRGGQEEQSLGLMGSSERMMMGLMSDERVRNRKQQQQQQQQQGEGGMINTTNKDEEEEEVDIDRSVENGRPNNANPFPGRQSLINKFQIHRRRRFSSSSSSSSSS